MSDAAAVRARIRGRRAFSWQARHGGGPVPVPRPDAPRGGSENLALEYVGRGVRVVSARFAPTVHGDRDHGFVALIVAAARAKGVSGHIGDGANRWSAVYRADAARLVRLGLERAPAGSRLHAVAEEGVSTKAIAEAIGRGLNVPVTSVAPEDAAEHFGFIGAFFAMDLAATSERTRTRMGWEPTGPTLIDDIDAGAYFH